MEMLALYVACTHTELNGNFILENVKYICFA